MRNNNDTIAALATSSGEGGIAIIRISGTEALSILKKVFRPSSKKHAFEHRYMMYGNALMEDGSVLDEVMAVYFSVPSTYTREDVAEIHTHGGLISGKVLERVISLGARPAEKGEFTYRAFLNGRIGLESAEAVMDLISASSEQAARASVRQLKGGVSSKIGTCREKLMELVSLIDAAADYPEEIDEEVTARTVCAETEKIHALLSSCADERYARILHKGASCVIAGVPNVGKSSVMNALLSSDRSIVTDIPGTTRDTVSEKITIGGVGLTLTDTAGIRETGDIIEKIGVDRAESSIKDADCVILVLDASRPISKEEQALIDKMDARYIPVANKTDLKDEDFGFCLKLSAKTGEGLTELQNRVYNMISPGEDDEKLMTLRHVECAKKAAECLDRVLTSPEGTFLDLFREDLTEALNHLGEITGENIGENVIDSIFERFCVGK